MIMVLDVVGIEIVKKLLLYFMRIMRSMKKFTIRNARSLK